MVEAVQKIVRITDTALARVYLSLCRERSAVLSFLFHSLFRNEREIGLNLVDPLQRTTVEQFRVLIEYYLSHDYQFISPDQLHGPLDPEGRYVLLTFDDGYYNNTLALPILEEYGVPALFFISTDHVLQNKCYWWDVIYRERMAQGATRRQAYQEALALKYLKTEKIEEELKSRFGPDAFTPRGDIDRPFSPEELRAFAASPLVHVGNHTAGHAILTNYTNEEVIDQIQRAQNAIEQMTGVIPSAIAYPNGAFNKSVIQACRQVGLKTGFTIRAQKCLLPIEGKQDPLRLGRFIPHGGAPTVSQCATCRSDLSVYGAFRHWYLRLTRRGVSA